MSLGLRNADDYEGEGRKASAAVICYQRYSKSSAVEQPKIQFCLPTDFFVNAPSMAPSAGAVVAEGSLCYCHMSALVLFHIPGRSGSFMFCSGLDFFGNRS